MPLSRLEDFVSPSIASTSVHAERCWMDTRFPVDGAEESRCERVVSLSHCNIYESEICGLQKMQIR